MSGNPFLEKRVLPNFNKWLEGQGRTERGEGFDDWASLDDLVRRTLKQDPAAFTDDELAIWRVFCGLGVAIIEIGNLETSKGRSFEQTLATLPRALGAIALYAFASACREDAPLRPIARILIEEFRFGAKEAADQVTEGRELDEAEAEHPRTRSGGRSAP